jgi:hypothetical protein
MTTPFPFVAGQILTAAQLNDIQNLPISDKTASYTLIVSDVYKRTIMNSASSTTITVNNSIFTVGDVIQVANKGNGVCTVTAGVGVTINTSGSLALAQYGGGYLLALSASTFTFFNLGGGANYGVATGGTATTISVGSPAQSYTLLTFTSDANLVVSKAGLFDVLLVGGGGGAGSSNDAAVNCGAGGGGAVVGLDSTGKILTVFLEAATYALDVGAGGASQSSGNASYITGVVASPRGGLGSGYNGQYFEVDGNGGSIFSGQRASNKSSFFNIAYGQYGGGAGFSNFAEGSGGGGGSASAGGNGTSTVGGAGGNGLDISPFIGGSTYYAGAGGGGGGPTTGGAAGNGGVAGKTSGNGNNGVNYGAGGGGSKGVQSGGTGAAGAIFIRFKV